MKQYPKLHPRSKLVSEATSDMASALHDALNRHDLTVVEYLQFLTEETRSTLGRMLREERQEVEKEVDDIDPCWGCATFIEPPRGVPCVSCHRDLRAELVKKRRCKRGRRKTV